MASCGPFSQIAAQQSVDSNRPVPDSLQSKWNQERDKSWVCGIVRNMSDVARRPIGFCTYPIFL